MTRPLRLKLSQHVPGLFEFVKEASVFRKDEAAVKPLLIVLARVRRNGKLALHVPMRDEIILHVVGDRLLESELWTVIACCS